MISVIYSAKMRHAIQAGEGGALTLAMMRVELLFGEDIPASLQNFVKISRQASRKGVWDMDTSQEKETITVNEQQQCCYSGKVLVLVLVLLISEANTINVGGLGEVEELKS